MAFTQALSIGSEVSCTTRLGKNVEGKVIALDEDRHVIVVQSFSLTGGPGKSDLHIVNLHNVSSLKIIKVGESQTVTLPPLSIQKIEKRFQENVSAKQAAILRIGKNVTPIAQKLFDDLYKKLPNQQCYWNDNIIIALGDVRIIPPYDSTCCTGGNDRSLSIVKKYVQRFHNENKDSSVEN